MTSASSAPGPSLPELRCFLGSLQSAGPHRGGHQQVALLPSHLLSPLVGEGGPVGNVAESWGFPRTREAEILHLQKVPGECPWETIFSEVGWKPCPVPSVTRGRGQNVGVGAIMGFGWCHFLVGGSGAGQIGGMPRGTTLLWGEGWGRSPSSVLGILGACGSLPASLPWDIQGRSLGGGANNLDKCGWSNGGVIFRESLKKQTN